MAHSSSRRDFLRSAALTSGALASGSPIAASAETSKSSAPKSGLNILMICADQFRADFVGANRENPTVRTPHLDALVERGSNFRQAVCNQPLCSPSRASFLTGVNATEANMWKLGLEMNHSIPSIATILKSQGYTTAFVGKWHVSSVGSTGAAGPGADGNEAKDGTIAEGDPRGWVAPGPSRGGFDDLWEGANVLEIVSHPYEGNYWDSTGKNIGFKDIYRVDFVTDRSIQFLEQKHDKPWLLFVSQLEPHHQNDIDQMVPPKRYEGIYNDPFVPHDLRNLPGNWQSHLPGYYGCVQAIDDCVGRLVDALSRTGQLENTIVVFFSDHGCTFRTRLGEYKRSPHESSLRVPLVFAGPGFDRGAVVTELVSLIDLTPTLLDGVGVAVPTNMRGKSLKPLITDTAARKAWNLSVYIQISQSICGRALRTNEWTYCAHDPSIPHGGAEYSTHYTDFALYSLAADPHEQVNLVGREEFRVVCTKLREELKKRIVENGEPEATITPMLFYA
jgi:arylsulfatase A-like enzyme